MTMQQDRQASLIRLALPTPDYNMLEALMLAYAEFAGLQRLPPLAKSRPEIATGRVIITVLTISNSTAGITGVCLTLR